MAMLGGRGSSRMLDALLWQALSLRQPPSDIDKHKRTVLLGKPMSHHTAPVEYEQQISRYTCSHTISSTGHTTPRGQHVGDHLLKKTRDEVRFELTRLS